ncbi:hypothetical protein [Wolbachia endosymbiont of Pentidionis agamae]|uniref:hypothetical protein n=1 Tax=Wolbachia endosymbiont of Pentidionis agamae TaxID=3110435 RepID=UPI002FD15805
MCVLFWKYLSKKQKATIEDLENLALNIRAIDFDDPKLKHFLVPHDFKTDIALFNSELGSKSKEVIFLKTF